MVSALDPRPPRLRSLDDLEGRGARRRHPRIARLRKRPIGELSSSALRTLLARREGIRHLLPIALERLERDPWLEACGRRGDLLAVVLAIDDPVELTDVPSARSPILAIAQARMSELDERDRARIEPSVLAAQARVAAAAR